MSEVVGVADEFLKEIERRVQARITVRGNSITVVGEVLEVDLVSRLISHLISLAKKHQSISRQEFQKMIEIALTSEFSPHQLRNDVILTHRGKTIRPQTAGQKKYVDAIKNHTITFGIGPAGTGKTFLAMALALKALQEKRVTKIILTRPVVEAGESLGFLPGTLEEKIDPYVRPLYDALFDMTEREYAQHLLESGIIEIAPLAFMRGRTLSDAFVILDEAQNTTPEQMKMFLTRLGFNSTFIVTGDSTQLDIMRGKSGLIACRSILEGIDDLSFVELTQQDVVRHSLVAKIIEAYAQKEMNTQKETYAQKEA